MARTRRYAASCLLALAGFASSAGAESWCDAAPAPEFATLEKSDAGDAWFSVYVASRGVFAISEPRQYEGVTSFLVTGADRAVLFDSGLGVADIRAVVRRLTSLPVTVVNSHTHFDHVGGNREFEDVRNLDDPYSLASARGEVASALAAYASETLAEDRVCGPLPTGVTSRTYAIPNWRVSGTRAGWRSTGTWRSQARGPAHARPHARFHLPARPGERAAVHRRHLLFRRDLSLDARDEHRRLHGVDRQARQTRARAQETAAGARTACRGSRNGCSNCRKRFKTSRRAGQDRNRRRKAGACSGSIISQFS